MAAKKLVIGMFGFALHEASVRSLRGALRYVGEHPRLTLLDFSPDQSVNMETKGTPPWAGEVDGMLTSIGSSGNADEDVEWIQRGGVPAVNLVSDVLDPRFPAVFTDANSIAGPAVKHLSACGCQRFMHVGFCDSMGSLRREEAFQRAVESTGLPFEKYDFTQRFDGLPEEKSLCSENASLVELLRRPPHPVGVLALNDPTARQLLNMCVDLELRVPQQVAIVGVDNSPIAFGRAPTITSILTPGEDVGYRGTKLVVKLVEGGRRPRKPIEIPAKELVPRESTGTAAQPDDEIARAIELIHHQAGGGMKVKEVAETIGITRRTLERKFKSQLGRSPSQEIERLRLAHGRRLLERTDFSISRISELLGFAEVSAFSSFFHKHMGYYPRDYRNRMHAPFEKS